MAVNHDFCEKLTSHSSLASFSRVNHVVFFPYFNLTKKDWILVLNVNIENEGENETSSTMFNIRE